MIGLAAYPSNADSHPSFQSYWEQVTHGTNCNPPADYNDFILVKCDGGMTLWYFTKPNHPAYPGVIKRMLQQSPDGSWSVSEEGHSFAPDSAQPAFKAWLAQIQDLDRQMREHAQQQN